MHKCDGCNYRDHSGSFTPGGALLTCNHPKADGAPDLPGDDPESMFLRAGMAPEDIKRLRRYIRGKERAELPDKYHWIRRVRPADRAPNWCPEPPLPVIQERLKAAIEHVRILREALTKAHAALDRAARYFDKLDDQGVVEEVENAAAESTSALDATKEKP